MGISGEEAGTALKSIISRIYRIGEEGTYDEGKSEKVLTSMGVAVRNVSGDFRSFGDILKDISNKWSTWNNVQKTSLAQTVAGKMCA